MVDQGRRLRLSSVTPADSGQYCCRASNKIEDASATILLTVDGMFTQYHTLCVFEYHSYRFYHNNYAYLLEYTTFIFIDVLAETLVN